jgi:hypothetical protein
LGITKLVLPGALLAVACLLPYLNKAYTIDDPCFLLSARQILHDPLQPMSFPICWMGDEQCVKSVASLGPGAAQALMGYALVPMVLAGGQEWMAHVLQILLACVAVLEMVRLALRLGFDRAQAACAGLMLVAIPPFLSMASTAMPDTLALTLGLSGIERLLAWKEERRWHQAVVCALTMGLAPYARPHLALLMPLGALWLFEGFDVRSAWRQVRREAYAWAPVVGAACLLATVNLITRDRGPAEESANTLVGYGHLVPNLLAYFVYLSVPIPLSAVAMIASGRKALLFAALPAIPLVLAHFMVIPDEGRQEELPVAAAVYGFAALVYVLWRLARGLEQRDCLLGLWVLLPLPAVFYAHLPIKYMLGVLPAIVLILIMNLAGLSKRSQFAVYGAVILGCSVYSCVLLRADADFAEYGRRAAAELIAPHVARGEKVWYGGQWGFYWYAQQAGATISIPDGAGPKPGDLLAVGLMEGGDFTRDRFPHRELVASRSYDSPHGRTMGYGAGLYSNILGYLPWVWAPQATNTYELWRIR